MSHIDAMAGGTDALEAPSPESTVSPPLRLVRLIARLNVGGPARHAIILDDGLRARGFVTHLIHGSVAAGEESLAALAVDRGLPTTFVPRLGRAISLWDDVLAFGTILRLLWRWQPDIVHTHTAKAGAVGRLAAFVFNASRRRQKRCAVVHTFHGHVFEGYFSSFASALIRTAERLLSRLTDRIIAISPIQRVDIVQRFGIAPAAKVDVIPLGLELTPLLTRPLEWRGIRSDLGYGTADYVVGYVGRLVPIKDVATLLRGIALGRSEMPQLRLLIAGDGDERPNLEKLAKELGLSGTVRFLGWHTDLRSLYAAMDLFVLTSINEGTPVSLIEAMAAGVPSVATAVGGVPDVIDDGVTGVLIPSRNPGAVADAIRSAARDTGRGFAMAERARLVVGERYDSRRLVEDIAVMYREVLARKRGSSISYGSAVPKVPAR